MDLADDIAYSCFDIIDGVRDTGGRVTLSIFNCKKPVIGAINGAAGGVGATMTLAMDIRMASTESIPGGMAGATTHVLWDVSFGTLLVLLALFFLFIELLKSTSTGTSAIFNHALSMLVFIICLVEFLLHPAFATSTFFIIMVMSLLDVLAGVVVTIVSARRDVEFSGSH